MCKVPIAFLITCLLLLPTVSKSQDPYLTSERIISSRAYSDTIINALREDLLWQDSATQFYEPGWDNTLRYLDTKLADDDFMRLFFSEIRKWDAKRGCVELTWQSGLIYDEKLDWVPVYVFLPGNDSGKVTLCSFRETTEPGYLQLPDRLRKYAESKIEQYSEESSYVGELYRITGDSLKQLFPDFARFEYWLINEDSSKKSRVSALTVIIEDFGPYQILAEFENPLEDAVFAFPTRPDDIPPRFVQYETSSIEFPLDTSMDVSIVTTPGNRPVFVSKNCPVGISMEMLYDPEHEFILQLRACFGNDWGNHYPCFNSKYLLEYDDELFVLRIANEIAELISTDQQKFRVQTVADETAPEL